MTTQEGSAMAALWTQQIIEGRKRFAQVPQLLREEVGAMLEDCGLGALTKE